MMDKDKLLTDFEHPSYQDWENEAIRSLDGKPIEKLFAKTYEDILVKPIYTKEDLLGLNHIKNEFPGFYPFSRGTKSSGYKSKSWNIAQEVTFSDIIEFNKAAKYALKNGQTVLTLQCKFKDNPEQSGCFIKTIEDFESCFSGIDFEKVPVFIKPSGNCFEIAGLFIEFLKNKKYNLHEIRGGFYFDPIAKLATEGSISLPLDEITDNLAALLIQVRDLIPNFSVITIDASPHRDAGGNAVQEIAFAISAGIEYLRKMEQKNIDINDIAPGMRFVLSAGSDFFMEIAKFRAARMLWAKIIKESGGNEDSQKMKIHVKTSIFNKSFLDPWTNMLRVSTETLSAVIGGADSIHSSAYDEIDERNDDFSNRIAKNTQLIFKEECNLTETIDPAGGSWYIETLTYQIAKKAWDLFRVIEGKGGMIHALIESFPQDMIEKTALLKHNDMASRKTSLVGINKQPNPGEKLDIKTNKRNNENNHDKTDKNSLVIKPLNFERLAEPFEQLRLNAENYKNSTGSYPTVFLANVGTLKQYKGRADFSSEFFRIGGFEILNNKSFANNEEIAKAYFNSKAQVCVICSSDDLYPGFVPELAVMIKKANPESIVILAGNPLDKAEEYTKSGIDGFIYLKADVISILSKIQKQIIK